jgi:hypothetical protein
MCIFMYGNKILAFSHEIRTQYCRPYNQKVCIIYTYETEREQKEIKFYDSRKQIKLNMTKMTRNFLRHCHA